MLERHVRAPEAYRALFERSARSLPGAGHAVVEDFRQTGFGHFERSGIPGPKAEAWKYTPVAGFAARDYDMPELAPVDADAVTPYFVSAPGVQRLVFVNGAFSSALSDVPSAEKGVFVGRLADALARGDREVVAALTADDDGERSFTALNRAFLSDGGLITVAPGVHAQARIQLVFVTVSQSGRARLQSPCNLVLLGDGASCHLIETHIGLGAGGDFVNLVNQIRLGRGAAMTHERLQLGAAGGSAVGQTQYDISADARLTQSVGTFAKGLVRNEILAALNGSGIEAQFNGLYLTGDGQHIDNALTIVHSAPGSISDQFYKGILDGKARAAFAGKIVVRREAQKTNAYQSNNNLLLSADAEINTKPELEIYADDVKCSHGATAGELDERELFYLRSRGLDAATARSLLTYAFAGAVLERFVDQDVVAMTRREVLRRLPGGAALEELA